MIMDKIALALLIIGGLNWGSFKNLPAAGYHWRAELGQRGTVSV